jgi:hypothetical protein
MCNRSGEGTCCALTQDKMLRLLIEKNKYIRELQEEVNRNEGRRLFSLCVSHGATPGNVLEWLRNKLDDSTD